MMSQLYGSNEPQQLMETLFRTQSFIKISELFREMIADSNQVLIASAYLTADG
jgi:hypothetical protein